MNVSFKLLALELSILSLNAQINFFFLINNNQFLKINQKLNDQSSSKNATGMY